MATAEQLQELVAAVQNLSMEVQNLKTDNNMLKQMVSTRDPRHADLPPMALASGKFDGTPKRLKFLDACSSHFTFRANTYTTDHARVGFVISNRMGNALAWTTHLVRGADPVLQDYGAFEAQLKRTFERPEITSVCEDLLDIRQGQADLTYISTFKRLPTDWMA
ncbi:protein LDOC1-like [Ambystoma mexicanum]|uniref:protein LDOC1-like n=1 Tax=Ambystoma mexicanum TaxID=8296 RepID=UPI0037E7F83A